LTATRWAGGVSLIVERIRVNNIYGLPEEELERIRLRDDECVYCHKKMSAPGPETWRGDWATIEHLNHHPPWDNPRTIAFCCGGCNSSRGKKTICEWFETEYCKQRNISAATVAQPVFKYIKEFEGFDA